MPGASAIPWLGLATSEAQPVTFVRGGWHTRRNPCWDEDYTFDLCCNSMFEHSSFHAIMTGRMELHGNAHCWVGQVSYEECCGLDANNIYMVDYHHAMWLLRLMTRIGVRKNRLTLLQGAVLENWQQLKDFMYSDGVIPYIRY